MEALLRAHRQQLDDLPDDEPLPRRAHLGMRDDFLPGSEPQKRVEDARVVHIDLGRAHLPLGDVLVPRGQLPHGEHRGQGVQVAAHGGVRDAEGAAELTAVPTLPVPMRQHGPEAAQGGGGHQAAEFWDVSRQEGADEPVPPTPTRRARAGQVGKREATAQPQALQVPHFLEAEAIEFVERHPPGEGLGGLPEQFRGSAAEHQKSCRCAWPVGQPRSKGRRSGSRWIPSSTTNLRKGRSSNPGSAKRARSVGSSKSNHVTGPRREVASCRARVDLPTCRAPSSATTGNSRKSSLSCRR